MRRTAKGVLGGVAVFTAFALTASADFTLQYAGGDTAFKIEGETGIAKAGQTIVLKVENDDGLLYTRQIFTDKNGKYDFDFALDKFGSAELTVSENGVLKTLPLYKSTETEVTTALGKINSPGNMAQVITEEYDVLQVTLEEFEEYNKKGIVTAYLENKTFASIADFKEQYNNAMFLAAIEKGGNDIYGRMTETNIDMGTGNAAKTFENYSAEEKTEILESMSGMSLKSDKEYTDALFEKVAMNEIAKAENINEKYAAAEKYNDVLQLDLSKYKGLNAKYENFKKTVFASSYETAAQLKAKCESTYADLTKSSVSTGGGGGGSSSGGSGIGIPSNYNVSKDILPTQTEETVYDDISGVEWAREAIVSLTKSGIVSGKGNNKYAPEDNVTRAEFAKMAVSAFNMFDENAEADFSDVSRTGWEYKYVASAVKNNIINGVGGGRFNGGENITREDIAAICLRILNAKGIAVKDGNTGVFEDENDIAEYAKDAVAALNAEGVLNGKGDNKFCPKHYATRAEAAKIIYALCGRQK